MEELYTIAGNTLFYFSGNLFHKAMGFFYRIVVSRLGKEEYGLFSLGMAAFGIFTIIALSGINLGLIHFLAYYRGKNDLRKMEETVSSAVKTGIICSVFFGAILYVFSGFIAQRLFHDKELIYIFKLFILASSLWAIVAILLSVPVAMEKVKYLVYTRQFFEPLANFLLAAALILLGFGIKGAVCSFVITQALCLVISIYFLKKAFPFRIDILAAGINWKLIRYSLPLTCASLSWMLFIWSDTLMIGHMKSPAVAGIYNAAVPFVWMLFVIPSSIDSIFLPAITKLYAQGKDIENTYRAVCRWTLIGNLPLSLLFILFSREIIAIFFGERYAIAHQALKILSTGYLIYSINYPKRNLFLILRKTPLIFILNASLFIISILLNFFWVPLYGIKGAAFAISLSLISSAALVEIFFYRFTKMSSLNTEYIKPIIAAGISTGFVYFINTLLLTYGYKDFPRVTIGSVLFLGFYAAGLMLFGSIKEEDKTLFKNYCRKAGRILFPQEETI